MTTETECTNCEYPNCMPVQFGPPTPDGNGIALNDLADKVSFHSLPIFVCRMIRETEPQGDKRIALAEWATHGLGLEPSDILDIISKVEPLSTCGTDGNEQRKPDQMTRLVVSNGAIFTLELIRRALSSNQKGDAELLIKIFENRFCYDHSERDWYEFTGHHWQKDKIGEVSCSVDELVAVYGKEALRLTGLIIQSTGEAAKNHQEYQKTIYKRISLLQTLHYRHDVLKFAAEGEWSLGIEGDQWDKDPMLLGCENGVIDLRTGELRDGRPEDYIRTVAPARYKGLHEPAPAWEKFLADIFNAPKDSLPDGSDSPYAELPGYLQCLLGYGITGKSTHHIYAIFWGPEGRNGKSTLLETIKLVLGPLAHKTRAEIMMCQQRPLQRGAADADTLALRGKRIVWASETNEGRQFNTGMIKEMTGGDTLNARSPYAKHTTEFRPTHLSILITNDKPHASAADIAFWERVHLVPFSNRFVDEPCKENERKIDRDLPDKLKAEASGILAWLVCGCLEWQRKGLKPPVIVKVATESYRDDEDNVTQFIQDVCIVDAAAADTMGNIYNTYKDWCKENGLVQPISLKKLSKELVDRECERDKGGRHTIIRGIAIRKGIF